MRWREEARTQLRLAVPVVVVQLGLMAMTQVDVAFLGRVDAVQVAGAAIGSSAQFLLLILAMGVLSALDPIVGQAHGARDEEGVRRGLQRGLLLAVLLSVPCGVLSWFLGDVMARLGVDAGVVPVADAYVKASIAGIPGFLVFVALRQTMQAMHVLRPLVVTIVLANVLNAVLDWVLIGGHLGVPPLGAVGSAWGTVVSRSALAVLVLVLVGPRLTDHLRAPATRLLQLAPLRRMLAVGLPIGLQWAIEFGAFFAIAALMGRLGGEELAGHQVTLQLASAAYMIPLGMSMAVSVRVGNEVGRGNPEALGTAARVALAGGTGVMALAAAVFLLAPRPLVEIYLGPELESVIAIALALLPFAAAFQVFDGIQVVALGVLRGLGDTRVPMWNHLAGFWGVALPLGYGLGFHAGMGPRGLWIGLAAGLAAVAVAQFLRLRIVLRRRVSRIVIDLP